MHIYNNYYNNIGVPNNSGYSLGPGYGSQFIVEDNYFGVHRASIVKYYDKSQESDGTFSRFYHSGNIPALSASNCSYDSVEKVRDFTKHETAVKPWTIPYSYTPEPAAGLFTSIPAGAGSRLETQDLLE
jgi:pectate lyase